MSAAAPILERADARSGGPARGLGLGLQVWLIAWAGLLAVVLPNLADPMIRYDDFPALLAQAETFWPKTLHEGRWVNYWWHLRGIVTPSWLNFALYQALWAAVAASAALLMAGKRAGRGALVMAALMILIAPPATLISLWFNTLIPGLALVALYAVLCLRLPARGALALMPPFTVLSFMAYTTYPLLILTLCLLRHDTLRLRGVIGVLALFSMSFLGAVLAVYALNWQVHGVFGVPLAAWREAVPASDLASLQANLPLVWQSFADLADKASFGFAPMVWFHLAVFAVSAVILARRRPSLALGLLAALALGIGLVVVQILKMGALVPPRGFIFLWVIYALMACGAVEAAEGNTKRWLRNAVLLVIGSYALQTFVQYQGYRAWQSETRARAVALPAGAGMVWIDPAVVEARSARKAHVQDAMGLAYRVTQITGRPAAVCSEPGCTPQITVFKDGTLAIAP